MQFGCMPKVQKRLKIESLPSPAPIDPCFCWDIDTFTYNGHNVILATNWSNWYSVLLYGVKGREWERLPDMLRRRIRESFKMEEIPKDKIDRYFSLAGKVELTGTHGYDSMVGLELAREAFYLPFSAVPLDYKKRYIPWKEANINHFPSDVPENKERAAPLDFLLYDLEHLP